jgi:hypothetical protein
MAKTQQNTEVVGQEPYERIEYDTLLLDGKNPRLAEHA